MIKANTKCVIKKVPGESIYASFIGAKCTAAAVEGQRGTGTQQFKLDYGGAIYGNGDSGFVVEAC